MARDKSKIPQSFISKLGSQINKQKRQIHNWIVLIGSKFEIGTIQFDLYFCFSRYEFHWNQSHNTSKSSFKKIRNVLSDSKVKHITPNGGQCILHAAAQQGKINKQKRQIHNWIVLIGSKFEIGTIQLICIFLSSYEFHWNQAHNTSRNSYRIFQECVIRKQSEAYYT
jgi:hypothetical protein